MGFKAGTLVRDVPETRGVWSVWSGADAYPGAHHLVPHDDEARACGVSYVTVRLKPGMDSKPVADSGLVHVRSVRVVLAQCADCA